MIYHRSGNIFETQAEAIVNPVNCVGVMGKGLAKEFKSKYPDNFVFYKQECENGNVIPGRMCVFKTADKYVINFPTKNHWGDKSKIVDIDSGLENLVEVVKANNIKSIAIPALGCGLGGLDWEEVKQKMEDLLGVLEKEQVIIYLPEGVCENFFKLCENFIERQEKLSLEKVKGLSCVDKSIEEIYKECCCLGYDWLNSSEKTSMSADIMDWIEYNESLPLGIYLEEPLGSITDSLTFCMSAVEYNVKLLYDHLKSRGVVKYRPLRVTPAQRSIYNYLGARTSEKEYCFENSYYDEEEFFK